MNRVGLFFVAAVVIVRFDDTTTTMQTEVKTKRALLFGGNGFIGAETTVKLLENGFALVCVSRGNWNWDSENRVRPYVHHVSCDRTRGLRRCSSFMKLLEDGETSFDLVVDFSAYTPEVVEEATALLKGRVRGYVLISTDSVYEVSVPSDHDGASREDDARRPDSLEAQAKLKKLDSYGHKKLACEEVLRRQSASDGGIPFVVLRLPDVIGPRDSTDRWWPYQLWVQFYHAIQRPLVVPRRVKSLRTSYVYVGDVAEVVTLVHERFEEIKNETFNVALQEQLTLQELLSEIAKHLQVDGIHFTYDDPSEFYLFPSVNRGAVDISKIKRILDWTPTSLEKAVTETLEFYTTALVNFPNERNEALETVTESIVDLQHKDDFLTALGKEVEAIAVRYQATSMFSEGSPQSGSKSEL